MKRFLAIALLMIAVMVWRMGALQQDNLIFITKFQEEMTVPVQQARLFGIATKNVPESGKIPLPNLAKADLDFMLQDLEWVGSVRNDTKAGETEAERIKRRVLALPVGEKPADLKPTVEFFVVILEGARYMQAPELVSKYARALADILALDDSSKLWNDPNAAWYRSYIQNLDSRTKNSISEYASPQVKAMLQSSDSGVPAV